MTIKKLFSATFACLSLCAALGVAMGAAIGASLPDSRNIGLSAAARITEANYCFARTRRLTPERQPPSYLVLRLRIQVAYLNAGTRPLIIPIEHDRTVYTALNPGVMTIFS